MMPMTARAAIQGASLDGRLREEGQVEAQETVGAHLQQDTRQDDRTGGRRFHVRIRQPGMQRPHRDFDGKSQAQTPGTARSEYSPGCRLWRSAPAPRTCLAVDAQPQDGQQHQDRASHRVEEELDRRINAARSAPDADQEVHRHQGEFPEDVEQEQILRQEDTHHAHFEQQEEDHEVLDALFDRRPGGEDRDRRQEGGQQDQQDAQAIHAQVDSGCSSPATVIQGILTTSCRSGLLGLNCSQHPERNAER